LEVCWGYSVDGRVFGGAVEESESGCSGAIKTPARIAKVNTKAVLKERLGLSRLGYGHMKKKDAAYIVRYFCKEKMPQAGNQKRAAHSKSAQHLARRDSSMPEVAIIKVCLTCGW